MTFIDDCIRYIWIYPFINKSEVLALFVKFCGFVNTQFNSNVQILQTDGGGEFNSKAFANFLASQGIVHHITCPHTPKQNGVTKRKNRHIVETSISLMSAAGLSKPFWFHSVAHSCYLINCMPCKSLHMHSPYELMFHKSPDLASLRIFGSACYPFIKPYNHDKLDPQKTQCIFLGYALGDKGVICFSPKHHKLWISRHVIHDEACFLFKIFPQPLSSLVDPVTFFPSPPSYTTVSHRLPISDVNGQLSLLLTELMGDQSTTYDSGHMSQNDHISMIQN